MMPPQIMSSCGHAPAYCQEPPMLGSQPKGRGGGGVYALDEEGEEMRGDFLGTLKRAPIKYLGQV